jgi:hypothetical protein
MNDHEWPDRFRAVFAEGVKRYRAGRRSVDGFFDPEALAFLAGIGCGAQELFDYVEDYCHGGDPSFETVLLVTAIRRDHFLNVQNGRPSGVVRAADTFPAKTDQLDGIAWLPRIIAKARAKLRGELPPELMYGCGGDRPFLRRHGMHLADFLHLVERAGDDDLRIARTLKARLNP